MKSIERFLDNVAWLFYGLIPALYLSIQSSIFSYKYRLFPDFIFVYVLAIIFVLIIFLIFRMFSKYHDLKKGKSTIFSTIFSYFSFPFLSSCVTAIFLFSEFKSVDRNAIFPYLFNYLLIQFFSWVLFIVIWYYKEEKRALELAKFENTQETQSELSVNSTELQEEKAKNTQLQAENERLKAELKAQQDRMAELEQKLQQGAVDSEPVLENAKAYDVRERETHLLMIGALSNLLAGCKQNYQKGNSGINQSAISRDIEHEIIKLLQPETKTRTLDTIRPRIRESLNLITKAE